MWTASSHLKIYSIEANLAVTDNIANFVASSLNCFLIIFTSSSY